MSEKPNAGVVLTPEQIAQICHEANRAYCQVIGDGIPQVEWFNAPGWLKESVINGVNATLLDPYRGPDESHESWLMEKMKAGWKYGPVKDPEKKEHPCCVPYDQLPQAQQLKDELFLGIVRVFAERRDGISREVENAKRARSRSRCRV